MLNARFSPDDQRSPPVSVDAATVMSAMGSPGVWNYSRLHDRLVLTGLPDVRASLAGRFGPGWLKRLYRPGRERVERYRLESSGNTEDVVIKYAPKQSTRIATEAETIDWMLRERFGDISGLLFPQRISVRTGSHQGIGLLSGWKPGGDLYHILARVAPERCACLAPVVRRIGEVLRRLHEHRRRRLGSHERTLDVDSLLRANPGDPVAVSLVQPVLDGVPEKLVYRELSREGQVWIHGDCFPYQFLLDSNSSEQVCLIDWETARFAETGFYDLAQFWASFELALAMHPRLRGQSPQLRATFCQSYGINLDDCILFLVLELQALIRFSPRTRKFGTVVRLRTTESSQFANRREQEDLYDAILKERLRHLRSKVEG